MSEIIVNMSGYGNFSMDLSLADPSLINDATEVWQAVFCDKDSGDCETVYFEMNDDYETWDLIDEAIQTYRQEIGSD